jgi:hypothetical protein
MAGLALAWVSTSIFMGSNGGFSAAGIGLVIVWLVGVIATAASVWLIMMLRRTHAFAKEPARTLSN